MMAMTGSTMVATQTVKSLMVGTAMEAPRPHLIVATSCAVMEETTGPLME